MPIDKIAPFRRHLTKPIHGPQFAVMPPYHVAMGHDDEGFPLYAYSSREIDLLTKLMIPLLLALDDFRKAM